ncbi:MAG: hypothetical protein MHMPM18_000967 [Marteilia pararefringens]
MIGCCVYHKPYDFDAVNNSDSDDSSTSSSSDDEGGDCCSGSQHCSKAAGEKRAKKIAHRPKPSAHCNMIHLPKDYTIKKELKEKSAKRNPETDNSENSDKKS